MLLMMHLETRLVIALLSDGGAMLTRPHPRTEACMPRREPPALLLWSGSLPRGVVLPAIL